MQTIVFDVETNGITDFRSLDSLSTIHCISLMDTRDGKVVSFNANTIGGIEAGLNLIAHADAIVGHNILTFDIPAIQKLYPDWKPKGRVVDTLVLSRLGWTDLRRQDFIREDFDKNLVGSHSLRAWGERLGCLKGDYGGTPECWDYWSKEMETYCEQDVRVTGSFLEHAKEHLDLSGEAVILEHAFAEVICKQWRNGIGFDEEAAADLHKRLVACHLRLEEELQIIFPPKEEDMKTRAYWITDCGKTFKTKKQAVEEGHRGVLLKPGPYRIKKTPFNPGSRVMIANAFIEKYGWEPKEFTPDGRPKVDETILRSLKYPEAKPLAEFLMIAKRLGQLAEGQEAWMRLSRDGRIFGKVNPNGAVTGRCTHSNPNVAQVPSSSAPWGKECRALFVPRKNCVMVGVDVSGLELRCLAHYMAKYDGGAYAREILEGDIHTTNQKAAGLPTRVKAKEFVYAYLYGAGNAKLGSLFDKGPREGRRLREQFLKRTPGLALLKKEIDRRIDLNGYLVGIDGRVLTVRSRHSALNTLLQSAGAVIVKKATVIMDRALNCRFEHSPDKPTQVAHIHDEIQFECPPCIADEVGEIAVESIRLAGEFFGFRCPLDGEYSVGKNWSETH